MVGMDFGPTLVGYGPATGPGGIAHTQVQKAKSVSVTDDL
jgi:hypothetical protein